MLSNSPRPASQNNSLVFVVQTARQRSGFHWRRAARKPPGELTAPEVEADASACDQNYRAALTALQAERYSEAVAELSYAAVKERRYGHGQCSFRALEALRPVFWAAEASVTGGRNTPRNSDAPQRPKPPLTPLELDL